MDGGLKETRRHLRAMTDRDLTTSPSPWGRDESAMLTDLRAMRFIARHGAAGAPQRRHRAQQQRIASGAMDLLPHRAGGGQPGQSASAMERARPPCTRPQTHR
jgi:methyl-accepting chemotaxis protein